VCAAVLSIGRRLATVLSRLQSTSNACNDPSSTESILSHLLLRLGQKEMAALCSLLDMRLRRGLALERKFQGMKLKLCVTLECVCVCLQQLKLKTLQDGRGKSLC